MMLPLWLCLLFDNPQPGSSPGDEIIWQDNGGVTMHWQLNSLQTAIWIVG